MNISAGTGSSIQVRDREGVVHHIEARPGFTLMEILRDAGLPIAAICGGNCLCATCHIYIDEAWRARLGRPQDDEVYKLQDIESTTPASRLSCQIEYTAALDGLMLTLAPEE